MSVSSEITRINNAKASIKSSIENKGVIVGDGLIDTYANKIDQIQTGTPINNQDKNITVNGSYTADDGYTGLGTVNVSVVPDTSDATATQSEIASGKTAYIAGGKVTGTLEMLPAQNIRGSYDRAGLLQIGYTNDDVDIYDGICSHYKSQNNKFLLSDYDKSLYGVITENNITSYKNLVEYCPYFEITKTNIGTMFQNFNNLKTIPLFNTSNVTNMNRFIASTLVSSIPLFDTSKVTDFSFFASTCEALKYIPLLDTSKATIISSILYYCHNLVEVPQFNTSNVIEMSSAFSQCWSLISIPQLNCSKVQNIAFATQGTYSLKDFGGFLNIGQAYLTSSSANYQRYQLHFSYSSLLTHDSLMNIINNLYDIATKGCNTQQLVLGATNMAKLTAAEINEAVAKGWTVS